MRSIALVGNKGGSGKTTLAINLACALNAGAPTLLLDADPQGSALQWRDIAGPGQTLQVRDGRRGLPRQLSEAGDFEFCVIDCPPSIHSAQTRSALQLAELALIPVQPSPLDLWASVHVEAEIEKARAANAGLRALLVINQAEPGTRLSRLVRDALAELSLPAAQVAIRRRVAHRNAVLQGRSVLEMGRRGADAAQEIRLLVDELGL